MSINSETTFSRLPEVGIDRSKFGIGQEHKTTLNTGELVPLYWNEILPGDSSDMNISFALRMPTLLTPFLDNLYLDIFCFYIPNRLLWNHWQNFCGESESAWYDPEVEYTIPQITSPASTGFECGTIADHLGVPINTPGLEISALPFRAYAKVCEDWFRSEACSDPLYIPIDDSTQTGTNGDSYINDVANGGKCFKVAKYHDYFSSCLPSPQFGESVTVPLVGQAPVFGNGKGIGLTAGISVSNGLLAGSVMENGNLGTLGVSGEVGQDVGTVTSLNSLQATNQVLGVLTKEQLGDNLENSGLIAELGDIPLISINELRTAFQVQKWQEAIARSGNRYIEIVKQMFNVTSPDARLQRSEFLGSKRIPIVVNQVIQTGETGSTPQGNQSAYSLTLDASHYFQKSFTEHGILLVLGCVRYHHTYQQGLERAWSRKTRFDFYWPTFANIGEQAVKNKEIYCQGNEVKDEDGNIIDNQVFGYQEAWAEYRYKPNRISGQLRSTYATSIDSWHLGDDYESLPHLSDEWIREDSGNVDRVIAVSESQGFQFFGDFWFDDKMIRPMPLYSVPGLMDHH